MSAVNSATSGLYLACRALGLKKMIMLGQLQILLFHRLIVLLIAEPK